MSEIRKTLSLEEKKSMRPVTPTNREEFNAWLDWYSNRDNVYAWDFNLNFEINGHKVSTNSGMFSHIVVDSVCCDVRDDFCTVFVNGVKYKPTDYIKLRIFKEV